MNSEISRREVVKAAGLGAFVAATGVWPPGAASAALRAPRKAFRIAHLTDIHVQPELRAGEGLSACLRHVNGLPAKPDLIITGGDQVMDSFDQGFERTKQQWDLWASCFKNDNGIPVQHVLGNHDIWGWNKKKSRCTGDEKRYGKALATERFARERTYTAFDAGGWRVLLLDSIQPKDDGYVGRLDPEQFAWLEKELAGATAPVAIFSHIPIFSVCVYNDGAKKKDAPDDWFVSGGLMHSDANKVRKLFLKHPNVRLCVSGHIHQIDRVEFTGVTYICDGAVCGRWWKGRNAECDEGYGLFDLHPDGTFTHEYVRYGWNAQAK